MKYYVLENHPNDSRVKIREDNIFQTLSSRCGTGGGNVPMVMEDVTYCMGHDERSAHFEPNKADPVTQSDYKQPPIVGGGERLNGRVRRLTPIECERLQGLPDNYTNIPEGVADSKRYKAIGNGMAQPCADWVISQIVAAERNTEGAEE